MTKKELDEIVDKSYLLATKETEEEKVARLKYIFENNKFDSQYIIRKCDHLNRIYVAENRSCTAFLQINLKNNELYNYKIVSMFSRKDKDTKKEYKECRKTRNSKFPNFIKLDQYVELSNKYYKKIWRL